MIPPTTALRHDARPGADSSTIQNSAGAKPSTKALAQWYGANRMLAINVAQQLKGCTWAGVPFAGGMSELLHIDARSCVANDLHCHIINLARVAADPGLGPNLYRHLRRLPFHPSVLKDAQARCILAEEAYAKHDNLFVATVGDNPPMIGELQWAVDYFVCTWMARGGDAGTGKEFRTGQSMRYDAGGGDSNVRFRSASSSLKAWRAILQKWNFVCEDAFEFIGKVKDRQGNGIYSDAPWPGPGECYRHKFTEADHRRLSRALAAYKETRVVIRFGVHPLIEELYPRDRWNWREQTSRAQSNGDVKEVLIINGPSLAGVA